MRSVRRAVATVLALAAGAAQAQSLYVENTFRALAADQRAFRAGDVITVQVFESSSASTTTDTATQRNNGLGASFQIVTPDSSKRFGGNVAVGGEFDGGGRTQRTNRLLATLTVSVQEVLPNGDLKLTGRQVLMVNDEEHTVSVEGRVRPQDVSAQNTVLSTRLADARITYVGDGALSERQRRGWWRAFLDWLGF